MPNLDSTFCTGRLDMHPLENLHNWWSIVHLWIVIVSIHYRLWEMYFQEKHFRLIAAKILTHKFWWFFHQTNEFFLKDKSAFQLIPFFCCIPKEFFKNKKVKKFVQFFSGHHDDDNHHDDEEEEKAFWT